MHWVFSEPAKGHLCVCGIYIKNVDPSLLFKISLLLPINLPWDVLNNDKNHSNYSLLNDSIKICTLLSLKQSHEGKKKRAKGCVQGCRADINKQIKQNVPC